MTKRSRLQTQAETGGLDTVTEATYQALRAAILSLELKPGSLLPIRGLQRRFPFGPTPLREALSRLAGEGLAMVATQRGFRVAPLSADDLRAIRLQCVQLEIPALRASIEANAPAWREGLERAYAAFAPQEAQVGDPRAVDRTWEKLHRCFHLALLGGCGSMSLLARIGTLYEMMDRYRRATLPGLAHVAYHRLGHEDLLRAALSGEADRAEALLREHLQEAAGQIAMLFEELPPDGNANGAVP